MKARKSGPEVLSHENYVHVPGTLYIAVMDHTRVPCCSQIAWRHKFSTNSVSV
jgi:hypothetical protein